MYSPLAVIREAAPVKRVSNSACRNGRQYNNLITQSVMASLESLLTFIQKKGKLFLQHAETVSFFTEHVNVLPSTLKNTFFFFRFVDTCCII